MITPNIESLASSGVILDQFYAQPQCSPSRGALLTGYYPIHIGLQDGALGYFRKEGLESQYLTIAERLKADFGYSTAMVGK